MKSKACCWILVIIAAFAVVTGATTMLLFSSLSKLSGDHEAIKDSSYLVINMSGAITERKPPSIRELVTGGRQTTLTMALLALERAETDKRIVGVVLRPMGIGGFAEIRELRGALKHFKESGKPVYAYLEVATDRDYYLATAADTIALVPARSGGMVMLGLSFESTYLRRTFEKVGIKFHVIHMGDYKGAFENFARDSMSSQLRENIQSVYDEVESGYVREMAASGRAFTEDELRSKLLNGDRLLVSGTDALRGGFVDLAMDWEEFKDHVKKGKEFESVSADKYAKSQPKGEGKREIAVVFAEGAISYPTEDGGLIPMSEGIVSDKMVKQLRELREDSSVAAVVLRVNSPGGSALASELIFREIRRLKAAKPVVVSMGRVAASGGYYISCAADRIIAQPSTITGSIGVVSMIPSAEGFYEKIAARVEVVSKGRWASFIRLDKPFGEEQERVLRNISSDIYEEFLGRVAEGRKMSVESVRNVAAGRIWTGSQALDRGLADELGGLDTAVARARELAKTAPSESLKVRYYPKDEGLLAMILNELSLILGSLRDAFWFTPEERELRRAADYMAHFLCNHDFVQAISLVELDD